MARRALSSGLMLALCVQLGFADILVQAALPLTLQKLSGSVPNAGGAALPSHDLAARADLAAKTDPGRTRGGDLA